MKLQIPYLSQHQDVKDTTWQNKSCGIVCVKMILDFLHPDEITHDTPDSLISEGIGTGGYTQEFGWNHESLVRLFRNRGINAYRQEFVTKTELYKKKLENTGTAKIRKMIQEQELPAIVSVEKGFDENTHSHLIVITGYEADKNGLTGFYYHDSDARVGKKEHQFVTKEKFLKYWRRFVIFVEN
jgi:hypothetical protein